MNEPVGTAAAALRTELADVERQLRGYEELIIRRRRLVDALRAVEAVDAPLANHFTLFGSFAQLVRHAHSIQLEAAAEPSPPSPVIAADIILRDVSRSLHIREIIALMQSRGWFVNREYESLRGTIAAALDAKARDRDTYSKPAPATYGLIEWNGRSRVGIG